MRLLSLFLCFFCILSTRAQVDRRVAVLDMTNYNNETSSSRKISAIHIMQMVGVPYKITTQLSEAIQSPVIITGSRIEENAFSSAQKAQLKSYVANGGILITSYLKDSDLFELCGVGARYSSNTLYRIKFDTTSAPIFDLINDSLEQTISIGDPTKGFSFYTPYYDLTAGISLANYENNKPAVIKNSYGQGTVYLFAPDFRDLVYRPQLNFDVNAQRSYSNGFEPSADVIFFIIRNIIRTHIPHSVFKYTIPYKYKSVLLITHDVDSQTAMDTMHYFSEFEKNRGITALYNITTSYSSNGWISGFYSSQSAAIQQLINDGHTIASHSVGHFPDFANEDHFPLGHMGNTKYNYAPHYHSNNNTTVGGSVYGEVEVSKQLLENDYNVTVKTFRAGHLAFNDSLVLALEKLGYQYNSTFSANAILTSFPYYAMKVRTFDGVESTVLEIPLTISDVLTDFNRENYTEGVNLWLDATQRYANNHSPIVLLIHPNRYWKFQAEKLFLNQLPSGIEPFPFQQYGRFWKKRDALKFHTTLSTSNELTVVFDNEALLPAQSFVIDYEGLNKVVFKNSNGDLLNFSWIPWNEDLRLYYQDEFMGIEANYNKEPQDIARYPVPTSQNLTIRLPKNTTNAKLYIYDLMGKKCYTSKMTTQEKTINVQHLSPGVYLLKAISNGKSFSTKFIKK